MDIGTSRRALLGAGIAAGTAIAAPRGARAQAARPKLRLGILTDLSGPYAELSRPSEDCARQAIAEFGAAERGWDVEVLVADHQNKADVAAATARRWLDQANLDAFVDVNTSATAFAVNTLVRERNKVLLVSGAGASDLTGAQCSPNTIHWAYDTAMLARTLATGVIRQGGDSWFLLGADYTFGHQLAADAEAVIAANGGTVPGKVFHPFPQTTDFSAFLLRAQASGAKVLGLCNAGADLINSVKQAREFGLMRRMTVVGFLTYDAVVKSLGLPEAQGLLLAVPYYWDLNDRTRAYQTRVNARTPGIYPNMSMAGIYASTLHYLKTVADMGIEQAKRDGAATVAHMKAMPTDDDCFGRGSIRADGRKIHEVHVMQAKAPAESSHEWDLLRRVSTLPPEQAFRPIADGGCPLVRG